MTFPAFAKSPKFLGWAAILVALIVGFFLYRGHQKPSSKSLPVTQAPATTKPPAPAPVISPKPSAFGSTTPTAETATAKPETKLAEKSPVPVKTILPPKISSRPSVRPLVINKDGKKEVAVTSEQLAKFSKLLETLVNQGITVHLIDETPRADAEGAAEAKAAEEKPMSDKELAEAYKEAVRKGRLP